LKVVTGQSYISNSVFDFKALDDLKIGEASSDMDLIDSVTTFTFCLLETYLNQSIDSLK
jgi:hypothetical protein